MVDGLQLIEEVKRLETEAGHLDGQAAADSMPEDKGPVIANSELFLPVISFACGVFFPAWEVQEAEQRQLAEAYGSVADKYFPDGITAFGPELNALMITAMILGPRLAMGVPMKEKEKQGDNLNG